MMAAAPSSAPAGWAAACAARLRPGPPPPPGVLLADPGARPAQGRTGPAASPCPRASPMLSAAAARARTRNCDTAPGLVHVVVAGHRSSWRGAAACAGVRGMPTIVHRTATPCGVNGMNRSPRLPRQCRCPRLEWNPCIPGARQAGPAAESREPAATVRLGRRVPGAWWCFNQVTVLPVLLAMAWLIPGTALLMAGRLRPAPLVLIAAPLAVILIAAVGRRVPGQRLITAPGAGQPGRAAAAWTGWWGLAGTIAVAAGFGAWQIRLNSPQVIVSRQPGALFQVGYWIAGHGSLPIPESLRDFGGAHPGLTFASTGLAAGARRPGPAVRAGAGDRHGRRLVDPRHDHGRAGQPGARSARGAHLRWSRGPAGRPAVGPTRGRGPGRHAARAVHEPVGVRRAPGAAAAARRAVPGGRLAHHPGRPGLAAQLPGMAALAGMAVAGPGRGRTRGPGSRAGRARLPERASRPDTRHPVRRPAGRGPAAPGASAGSRRARRGGVRHRRHLDHGTGRARPVRACPSARPA